MSDEAVLIFITFCLLFQAFHCAEPSSRQVACVPLFAALMAYEVYYGLEEEEGAVPMEHQVGEEWRGQACDYLGTRPPRA